MIDYAKAIQHARPGEEWTLNGNTYDGLTWISDTTPPSNDELIEAYDNYVTVKEHQAAQAEADRQSAIVHAKSLGFTDAMIAVMYPNLMMET